METKRWLVLAPAVLLALALAVSAGAQVLTPEQGGYQYSITAGAAFPVANTNQNVSGMVGISWYGEAGQEMGESSSIGMSIDWTSIERFDGKGISVLPALVNLRQYRSLGGYRIFGDIGLGIRWATDDIPEMAIQNGVEFAWQLAAGVDITNNIYGQVRFIAGSHPGDDGLICAQLGCRF